MAEYAYNRCVSVALETGVEKELELPEGTRAVRITADDDIEVHDVDGSVFPLANGDNIEWQDANLSGVSLLVQGLTGKTAYAYCVLGAAS